MSKAPYRNLSALQTKKLPQQKKNKNKAIKWWKKEDKEARLNTRNIRFSKRSVGSLLTIIFYTLFIIMAIVLALVFGRLDTIARLAVAKQVKVEDVMMEVTKEQQNKDRLIFQGREFLMNFFTVEESKEAIEHRREQIQASLAKNLMMNQLESVSGESERHVTSLSFVELAQRESEQGVTYRLKYQVTFTENEQIYKVDVSLPVSYKQQDFKVIGLPVFLATTLSNGTNTNGVEYHAKEGYHQGEVVSQDKKGNLQEFTKRFFELYVTNDENLKLISAISGLERATLSSINMLNIVQDSETNSFFVEGTFTFFYEETSKFTSGFSLEIEEKSSSYFVTNLDY